MDAANLYFCGSCKVQRVLRHRYGINGRGTELQLHRGSQSTLNQFCGTEGGMEGIRRDRGGQYSQHSRGPHHLPMQCHPFMKRPSCSLLLLSFKHVSRLLAVRGFWHRACEEGWPPLQEQPPQDGGLCPGKGGIHAMGTPGMSLHMSGSTAHVGSPSIPVMSSNAGHAQKCARGQSGHYADYHYSLPVTAMGCFQEQVWHYRSYISSLAALSRCL